MPEKYIKKGMGGSCCGKGRREETAILKKQSRKDRRQQAKREARQVQSDRT